MEHIQDSIFKKQLHIFLLKTTNMSKTLEEQLLDARSVEEQKLNESIENGTEYKVKTFEILEDELREVLENEGTLIRENPLSFPASVQRKYF